MNSYTKTIFVAIHFKFGNNRKLERIVIKYWVEEQSKYSRISLTELQEKECLISITISSLEAYLHDLYKVDNKIQVQYKILLYENK